MADGSSYDLGLPANAPESVKARLMAARLLAQSAAQQTAPYTSKGVVGLKAIEGLMGGLQERSAINEAQQGQAAQRAMMANYLLNGTSTPAMTAAGAGASGGAALATPGMIPGSAPTGPANALPSGGDSTRDLAIRTIYGEAGGESDTGKAGVASVLKNRLASGQFGPDMQSVILAPKQFSLWNAGDPAGDNARKLSANSPTYQRIGSIYDGVMSGQTPDPTGGATHYYNPRAASPAWGPKLAAQNDVTIGNHRFVGAGPSGPNGASSVAAAAPTASSAPIGDATVLAARNRLASGTGTDADRATVSTYLQQQNTPAPSRTASADVPAPNAQPVASSSLPPGVTPDMLGPGASAPSPFGAMPQSMAQAPATPDAATLAAALRGSASGSGPGATPLPATVQPSSPFGAMPTSMNQAPAAVPGPTMANAPPPSPQPSPFGAGPQPMQGNGGADPAMLAALLQRGAPNPAMGSPAPDPSIMQAGGPTAPQAPPLSSNALAMGDLAPGGPGPAALDPSGAAMAPLPATGLSTGSLPGFDNVTPNGGVQQSMIGDSGFTGTDGAQPGTSYNTPGGPQDGSIVTALQGNLPSPAQMAMGASDLAPPPQPGQPSPAVMAAALRQPAGPSAPPAPTPAPTSAPAPMVPPAPAGIDQSAGPAPIAALGASPDPSDVAGNATRAMQAAGMDVTGLPGASADASRAVLAARNGAPPPANLGPVDPSQLGPSAQASLLKDAQSGAPLPTMAGANVPPPDLSGLAGSTTPPPGLGLPIMARASSNPPAALQQDFAGLGRSSPQGVAPQASMQASALPQSGPTPPSRPSNTALGLNPDAPAPGAATAGPAPVSPQMLASLLAQQPMGLPGQGGGDPSSPQNFMRQEAQRAQGGPSPVVLGAALRGQIAAAAPASSAPTSGQDDGNPLAAIGRLFGQGGGQGQSGGNPLASLPIVGQFFGGGQQQGAGPGGQAASPPAYGGQPAGSSFTPGGQGSQSAQGGAAQGSQATVPGLGMSQQQAIALLSNPYTTPQQAELIMSRLAPQPMKLSQGEGLVGRRPDGTYGNLYTQAPSADWTYDHEAGTITNKATGDQRQVSAAPRVMSPGQQLVGPNGVQAAVPQTPDYKPVPGTGTAMNSRDGSSIALPGGAGASVHSLRVNGVDVPVMVTPDPNGGAPKVQMLTPGASGAPGLSAAAPGTPAAAAGPLDAVAPLVKQAGQMKADEAAQVKDADTQVGEQAKIAQAGRDARQKLAQLDQLEQLSGKFGNNIGTKLNAKFNEYGWPTQSGSDQEAFKGMVGALAVGERPAGSGALRVAEMDAFKSNLGDLSTNQAGRIAAINRYRTVLQRDAQMGDLASDPTISPPDRAVRLRTLSQTPYAQVGGVDGASAASPQGGPATASATAPQQQAPAPVQGARQAPNGNWYVADPNRPGKYMMVQ
ncbi:hypothetical protein D3273_22675 [Lichenibacterium minor]|uniref:Cell wall hydrolase SleB domain-containing protein n=1 Tax=Lichenibacterium minor TaxID=2316528 RepID=A0A4Q2TZV4_9HYPH|nr:cell wall hydrolase [Lichenibacterium minor]RYC29683.1 hypothetical protein D3273_22675 [Lichenibacterium minor]